MQMCVYLYTSIHKRYQGNMVLNHATFGDSGTPQGSILGHILLLICVNDLPSSIQYSRILLFADNAKLYRSINCDTDMSLPKSIAKYIIILIYFTIGEWIAISNSIPANVSHSPSIRSYLAINYSPCIIWPMISCLSRFYIMIFGYY